MRRAVSRRTGEVFGRTADDLVSKQTDDKTLVVVFDSDGPWRRAPQGACLWRMA